MSSLQDRNNEKDKQESHAFLLSSDLAESPPLTEKKITFLHSLLVFLLLSRDLPILAGRGLVGADSDSLNVCIVNCTVQ